MSEYPNMTNGCKTTKNFFGSGHGKNLHDGASVVIKRLIRKEQLDANYKMQRKLFNFNMNICQRD